MSFQETPYYEIPYPQQYGAGNSSVNLDSNQSQIEPTFKRQPSATQYEHKFRAHSPKAAKKTQEDSNSAIFGQKDCRSKVYHQMLFSNQDNKVTVPKPSSADNIMTEFFEDSEEDPFTSNLQPVVHTVPPLPVTKSTPITPRFIINPSLFENQEPKKENSLSTKSNLLKQNAAMFTFQEGKFSMNDSQIQETWKDSKSNPPPLRLSPKPTSKKSARSPRLLADYKQFADVNNNNNNDNDNNDDNSNNDDANVFVF